MDSKLSNLEFAGKLCGGHLAKDLFLGGCRKWMRILTGLVLPCGYPKVGNISNSIIEV